MSVFLRLLAMSWSHAGCGRPGLSRSASLRTWWTCQGRSVRPHHSQTFAFSRSVTSVCDRVNIAVFGRTSIDAHLVGLRLRSLSHHTVTDADFPLRT